MVAHVPSPPPDPTAAQEWISDFIEATRRFVSTRPIANLTVKVTLAWDHWGYVQWMRAGPGPGHLTIGFYPEDDGEMLRTEDGLLTTPTALIVLVAAIRSVELLAEPPTERGPVGFHSADEAEPGG